MIMIEMHIYPFHPSLAFLPLYLLLWSSVTAGWGASSASTSATSTAAALTSLAIGLSLSSSLLATSGSLALSTGWLLSSWSLWSPLILLLSRLKVKSSDLALHTTLAALSNAERGDDGFSGRLDFGKLDKSTSFDSDNLDLGDFTEFRSNGLDGRFVDRLASRSGLVGLGRPVGELSRDQLIS